MTIPSDPREIEKLKELADRNIANGDWGDEVNIPGLPGETSVPITPEEHEVRGTVSEILAKMGAQRLPKRK